MSATAPAARHRGRAARLAALVPAVLIVALGACTAASPATNEASPGTQPHAAAPTNSSTAAPDPDKLADPGVGPGQCKVVTYTPPGAKEPMPGELCRPKDNQRDVAVIVVHGGSGISGSYTGMRRWANRYLVEGYVTFLPEYHLFNPGSGESPVFPRPEQNIKAAVQYLRGTGNALGIRKDRIVVQGQSAGARVGAVAFTTPNDPWFAGAELYPGISDEVNGFVGFYHPYDGTMQYADQYFGGNDYSTDPKIKERLDKGDSLAHATQARGPAIFIVGDQDWPIIDQQQAAFAGILEQEHFAASSIVVKGGGHGFDEGGPRLSKLGEQSAVNTLAWLNDNFPQTPPRGAQTADADVANAPTYSGAPPTTYQARPAPSGGYNSYGTKSAGGGSGSGSGSGSGHGSGNAKPSGGAGGGAATTVTSAPVSVAPSSSAAPPSSAAVTTPPTTAAPVTAPTTAAPVTTKAPATTAAPVTTAAPGPVVPPGAH